MKNYNIENDSVAYRANLTSELQAARLQAVIDGNPDKNMVVRRIPGDPRSAWRRYHNDPTAYKIGASSGSGGNSNYHSTWVFVTGGDD